ncbi:MAG TPA: PD-(D/E)XK nuclease family protein, partial [Ignavibacteriaceae bacterium]|nr:PD-(D/E)XK nuclease family protein [Ignavibacteriaceae bacterium]
YTGFIKGELSEKGKNYLEDMKNRSYSISQLEIYALCPYRYFAERILRLNIFEEPTEEIEALEMGSMLHSILFSFYTELKKKKIILSGCSHAEFNEAEKLLFKIAEEKVNRINFDSPLSFYEREKIFGIEGRRENSILYKFLIIERENEDGYIPEFLEAGFGKVKEEKDQKIRINELRAGDIKVRGKIDRIDINTEEKTYKVYDYKTGKSRLDKSDIMSGIQLQLPLYLYAAKEIIKAELYEDYEPAGASIYSLKYKNDDFGRKELNLGKRLTDEEITEKYEEIIKICLTAVNKYVDGIRNGDFRLSQIDKREEKACRFCGFKPICRIQESGA